MPVTIVGNNTPTAGGVVYGDGTNYVSTAAGTSGQVLQSNGASAPSWATMAAAGMVKISTFTANNTTANADFTGLSGYTRYLAVFDNIGTVSFSSAISLYFGTGGTPTYITSNYYYNSDTVTAGTSTLGYSAPASTIPLLNFGAGGQKINGYVYITASNSQFACASFLGLSTYYYDATVSGGVGNANPLTAIRFTGGGNFPAGSVTLYGLT